MVDTAAIRSQMPSVENAVYFNTGTFGPFPLAVRDAMTAHVEGVWQVGRIGDARYAEQSAIEAGTRAALGRVVNASGRMSSSSPPRPSASRSLAASPAAPAHAAA